MALVDALIGQTVSHYLVLEKLGEGGMGVVYKAADLKLRRNVALKFLAEAIAGNRDAFERFKREARSASALNHPGIYTIYEFGEHQGKPFLAMELIQGCSLRAFRDRTPTIETLTDLMSQAAKALAAAHAAGIIHRDIKPENIMVRDDGYLKLVDFGLARFANHPGVTTETTATAPGTVVGTIRYMSPEQLRAETLSSASDVFSLGVVLYELTSGRHPFAADSHLATLSAILSATPMAPSQFNPEICPPLDALIRQMLEKNGQMRPTALEVASALTAATRTTNRAGAAKPAPRRSTAREGERRDLWNAYRRVSDGRGTLLCLSGEPGIGKTTLAEAFLEELECSNESCFVARGRCSERLAGTEAYLSIIEGLESLVQRRSSGSVIRAMKALAPAWFAQVATVGGDEGRLASQPVTQEQLKRQLLALLRELSLAAPVVLFLDDLHWADHSTIDLLGYLGTKFCELRLTVLVTYRPSDLRLAKHPFLQLKLDLEARGDCRDIQVGFLSRKEIENYLASEFPESRFPADFAGLLHSKTEGNPLFLVNLVRYLADRQIIVQENGRWTLRGSLDAAGLELPASVRSMIQRKIEKLSEGDQRLLAAASVQGEEFDASVVAAVLAVDAAEVEERLAILENLHFFFRNTGEILFPDHSVSSRYRFVHVLYQNAFYSSLLPARRRSLSAATAAALERHHGSDATSIAGQLAVLYAAARDFLRSSNYFLLAAKHASRLSAHRETVKLARCGLEQLASLPDNADRMNRELGFLTTLATSLLLVKGYGDPEVEQFFRRAHDLARQTGHVEELLGILRGLCFFHGTRGQVSVWRGLHDQIVELGEQSGDPGLRIVSYHLAGDVWLWLGDFAQSREFLLKALDLYRAERDRSLPERFGAYDLAVGCRMFLAHDLWHLGYPDQARAAAEQAVAWAHELRHPYSVAASSCHCAWIYILRGEPSMAEQRAQECLQVSTDRGFPFHIAHAKAFRGWALSERGQAERGIAELREGIEIYRSIGAIIEHPFMAMLLADAQVKTGRVDLAWNSIDTALEGFDGSPLFCDAEIARWRGELLEAQGADRDEIGRCFSKALEIARMQNAKSLELRAATSLARREASQGNEAEARQLLEGVYRWFTEGFETTDLKVARALLESLI
jgi:tetratricopeptide (TPR) repeat protein